MKQFHLVFRTISILAIAAIFIGLITLRNQTDPNPLPMVAIANYGPHGSLEASIIGIKEELAKQGYIENQSIRYTISDVGFNASLIPQMISTLKSLNPKLMVVITTPVAQYAKSAIKDIPLIYAVITDPVEAGLIQSNDQADNNMTGSADQQDLRVLLHFAKKLIPHAKRIGMLYATSESNDIALLKMMKKISKKLDMELVVIPVDDARDVPIRMQFFKNKVDFIYVGASGPIQPTLPIIAAEANKMKIPVLNVDPDAVKESLVLASFGVDYKQVGANAGKLVAKILNGVDVNLLNPIFPTLNDHHGHISVKQAQTLGITIPNNLNGVEILE